MRYNVYLQHQRYYDDLKHIDYQYIDYGQICPYPQHDDVQECHLIVEQDKALGKGGFCWDAAFILGEYVIQSISTLPNIHHQKESKRIKLIELGCGTALCGMMIARTLPYTTDVTVTDIEKLMPLVQRNICRNFVTISEHHHVDDNSEDYDQVFVSTKQQRKSKSVGMIHSSVLEWVVHEDQYGTYDVVIGSDVVASLYDPIALASTIHNLCHKNTGTLLHDDGTDHRTDTLVKDKTHNSSIVYISFKERLSSIHRLFENEMAKLFDSIVFVHPPPQHDQSTDDDDPRRYIHSGNRNPDVQILIASQPKQTS